MNAAMQNSLAGKHNGVLLARALLNKTSATGA